MRTSLKGKIALAVSEGIVDTAYKDSVGVWTIGIGLTKAGGVAGVDPVDFIGKKVSIEQIFAWFDQTIKKFEKYVDNNVKVQLTQQEYDALVHFVVNVGEPNFKKSNLLKLLNAGKKKEAFDKGFHGWVKPPELKGRRDKEKAIAVDGKYGSTIAPLYTADKAGKLKTTGTIDLSKVDLSGPPTAKVVEVVKGPDLPAPVIVDAVAPKAPDLPTPNNISFLGMLIKLIASLFGKK